MLSSSDHLHSSPSSPSTPSSSSPSPSSPSPPSSCSPTSPSPSSASATVAAVAAVAAATAESLTYPALLTALHTILSSSPFRFLYKAFLSQPSQPKPNHLPAVTTPPKMMTAPLQMLTPHPGTKVAGTTGAPLVTQPATYGHLHPHLQLTSLPDELIAMCYAGLAATDLVNLEHVSTRLRTLISTDSVCWKHCTQKRWKAQNANHMILAKAARHAGSWKALYSEKALSEREHTPWSIITRSETLAIIDFIAPGLRQAVPSFKPSPWVQDRMMTDAIPCTPPSINRMPAVMTSASPVSVLEGPNTLSIVVLIDASSSVTDEDFACMKAFTRTLVKTLQEAGGESQIGLIQFNQHPRVELGLTALGKAKVNAAIEAMDQLMGSTDIAAPIRRARQMLVEEASPGDRVIVLLTDGQTHADELHESEREARKAGEECGARVYTLGVGRDIDEGGLARVAAGAPGGMHFTLRRFVHAK